METLSMEILAAVAETCIMTWEAPEIRNILKKLIAGSECVDSAPG